jgi:hypothetical protein
MSADAESYEARRFLKIRRAYLHNFEASRRKHFIHGLVEMDVTEIRRAVRLREAAGEDISFTAVSCMLSPVQWTRTASCTLIAAAAS